MVTLKFEIAKLNLSLSKDVLTFFFFLLNPTPPLPTKKKQKALVGSKS